MNILNKVTIKFLVKNKTRTIVTIIGIILSAAMFTAVTTFISSLQDYMLDNAIYNNGDWHGAFYDIDSNTAKRFRENKRIESAAYAHNLGYADIGSSNEYKPYLFIMGADDLFMDRMPIHLIDGKLPDTPEEIILPEHLAYNGGVSYKIGDIVKLDIGDRYYEGYKLMQNNPYVHPDDIKSDDVNNTENDMGNEADNKADNSINSNINSQTKGEVLTIKETRTYTVVGFYERPSFEDFSAPGYTAVTKMDPAYDFESFAVYFKMKNPKETFDYVNQSGFEGTTNTDVLMYSGAARYDTFYSVLYSLGAILIGLIMFGSVSLIYNAFAISVSERTRQFGLLASIGATKRQSRKMVLFEALVLSSIGIPLGILSGVLGIGVTLSFIGDKFYAFYGTEGLTLDLDVSFASIVIAATVALVTVLISAWIPSKRAAKVAPIDAIRLSNDINVKARSVKTSKLTYKLFGLEGMIARKHFKRNRKKYRATVFSLFMSIVLFISASSFCTYLSDAVSSTFQDTDYDIVYYFTSANEEDISPGNLEAIYRGLSDLDEVTSLSYALSVGFECNVPIEKFSDNYLEYYGLYEEMTEEAITVMVYGVGDEVYRQYLKNNNLSEAVYMDVDNPRGIAKAVFSKFDQNLGKYVNFPILKDRSMSINYQEYDYEKLNALTKEERQRVFNSGNDSEYSEYIIKKPLTFDVTEGDLVLGLNESVNYYIKIMYPISIYQKLFHIDYCNFFFKAKNPEKAYIQIDDYLTENNLKRGKYSLLNLYEMNETDRNMVTIIKVFSYGFITLISLIALANVFNTISTNIMLRRREFAMLKSVGMTTGSFNKMMNFECLLYGFKSLLWGIPVAFGVTWLIYQSINEGYETGFYLPWTAVVVAILSVFAVVFATMIYSMRKIKNDNLIDALRNENL
ncbi:MAG TPA: ABC transporter permease [Clostridiaceae bacterium]|nr:ABC transporter permease [Clostridiaceae bacterium]